jgi:hypothetical protein
LALTAPTDISLGAFFVWQTSSILAIGAAASLPVEKYPSLFSAQVCSSPERNASQAQARAELAAAAAAAAKSLPSGLDPRSRWRLRTQAAGTAAVAGASARERVEHPASAARPCCGGSALRKIGQDVTEMLEHVQASWKSLPRKGGDPARA